MNRRKFLTMLAALPIVGRLAPKSLVKEPLPLADAAVQQIRAIRVQEKGFRIPALAYHRSFEWQPDFSDFGADMYAYPTKRLDLQIVDATTPGDVPDTSRQEPEPDHR